VSREFISLWYLPLQKNVLPSFTISTPSMLTFLSLKRSKYSCGKSPPTTEIAAASTLSKFAAAKPIKVAAPPRILLVLPKLL